MIITHIRSFAGPRNVVCKCNAQKGYGVNTVVRGNETENRRKQPKIWYSPKIVHALIFS